MPRDTAAKKVKIKQAKRQLFGCNQESKARLEPKQHMPPLFMHGGDNDFAHFVQQQANAATKNAQMANPNKVFQLFSGQKSDGAVVGQNLQRKQAGLF